jgi:hypothetical protein
MGAEACVYGVCVHVLSNVIWRESDEEAFIRVLAWSRGPWPSTSLRGGSGLGWSGLGD